MERRQASLRSASAAIFGRGSLHSTSSSASEHNGRLPEAPQFGRKPHRQLTFCTAAFQPGEATPLLCARETSRHTRVQ